MEYNTGSTTLLVVEELTKSVTAVVHSKNMQHREMIRRREARAATTATSSHMHMDTSLLMADVFAARMMTAITPPDPPRLPYEGALMKVLFYTNTYTHAYMMHLNLYHAS